MDASYTFSPHLNDALLYLCICECASIIRQFSSTIVITDGKKSGAGCANDPNKDEAYSDSLAYAQAKTVTYSDTQALTNTNTQAKTNATASPYWRQWESVGI